ncbi:MAG: transporter substrate-binding domain-containing protein [Pseudomonadales bacterium]|nr:transporter substrate-binding domain-containing protein [Pseudomonadales bacterium]
MYAATSEAKPLHLTLEEKHWLEEHPNVNWVFQEGAEPFVIEHSPENHSGFIVEIMNEVADLLSVNFHLQLEPMHQIPSLLSQRQYDGMLAGTQDLAKISKGLLSQTYLTGVPVFYGRMQREFEIYSHSDLAGKRIATVKGRQFTEAVLNRLPDTIEPVYVNTVIEGLTLLATNKVDLYVGSAADSYQVNKLILPLNIAYIDSQFTINAGFVVRDDWPIFITILNKALQHIGQYRINQIVNRWVQLDTPAGPFKWPAHLHTWLDEHPIISMAMGEGFEPLMLEDDRGIKTGIIPDMIKAINQQTGINIQLQSLTLEQLSQGIPDHLSYALASQGYIQKHHLLASATYAEAYPVLFIHQEATFTLTDMSDIKGLRIALIKNRAYTHELIKPYISLVKPLYFKDSLAAMQAVTNREADIYIGGPIENYQVEKYGLNLKVALVAREGKETSLAFAVNQTAPELVEILNLAIHRVGRDNIDLIIKRWSSYIAPQEDLAKKDILSSHLRQWLNQHPNIQLGYFIYPPVLIQDEDGNYHGVAVDLLQRINQVLSSNMKLNVQKTAQESFNKIKNKDIDILLAASPIRAKELDVSISHKIFSPAIAIFKKTSDNSVYDSIQNINNKRIAVVSRRANIMQQLQAFIDEDTIEVIPVKSPIEGFSKLLTKDVDVYLGFSYDNYFVIKEALIGVEPAYIQPASNTSGLAIRKDWPELLQIINIAISTIGQREITNIISQWINIPHSSDKNVLTQQERQWLKSLASIKVAISPDHEPFEYLDENHQAAGINSDYIKIIENKLGLNFEYVTDYTDRENYTLIINNQLQMGLLLNANSKLDENLLQTQSYMQQPLVIAIHKNTRLLTNIEDIQGERLGVLENSAAQQVLNRHFKQLPFTPYTSMKSLLTSLNAGRLDVVLANSAAIDFNSRLYGLDNIKIAASSPYFYAPTITVHKTLAPLIPILNKTLNNFSNDEKKLIYDKWVNQNIVTPIDWTRLLLIIGLVGTGLIILFSIIIYWNQKLKTANNIAEDAREKAEQANHTKSLFLANMSHEIRTPMNAVLGFSELLQRYPDTPLNERQESLEIINKAGSHLLSLINNILDLSKLEAGKHQLNLLDFDIKQLIKDLEDIFLLSCNKKNIVFKQEDLDSLPNLIQADEGKIRQILINLIGNAVKFTHEGQVVCRCHIESFSPSQWFIKLDIIDSGVGISAEDHHKVFTPFEQTQSGLAEQGGSGLGLSISREFARLMQGDVTFTSEENSGSCFSFSFIANITNALIKKQISSFITGLDGAAEKTLIIADDIVENRLLLKRILQPLGFTVLIAESGFQVMDLIKHQPIDLILMDSRMQGLNGLATTQAIREQENQQQRNSALPIHTISIIGLTASVMKREEQQWLASGLNVCLHKPFKCDELLALIATSLNLSVIYTHNQRVPKNLKLVNPSQQTHQTYTTATTRHILIVDDNPVNRLLIIKQLSKISYRCSEAENGQDALSFLQQQPVDFIILDVEMPVMDGYGFLQQRAIDPCLRNIPVIVSSANNDKDEQEKLLQLGANVVFAKPIDVLQLQEWMQQCI